MNDTVRENVRRWAGIAGNNNRPGGVTTALLLAVIARESSGNPNAQGSTGDYGLMQITKPAWQDYQAATNDPDTVLFPDAMLSPDLNVRVGSWYLWRKIEEMGTVFDGLRAYNRGAVGARANPNAGSDYAGWVVDVGLPAFREWSA